LKHVTAKQSHQEVGMNTYFSKQVQSEALAKFGEVARKYDGKPVHESFFHKDEGAQEAIDKLPDPIPDN
jgi:hypothetical protein